MFFELLRKKIIEAMLESPISKITRLASIPISHFTLPIHVQIEPTTKCNLNCKTCIRSKEPNSDMPLELFKSIINQLKCRRFPQRRIDLTGLGEPLLNPKIVSMVKYAKENGLQVSFTSNFTLINRDNSINLIKAHLDYLYVSFDGASKKTFEKIRVGADFEKVTEKVKLFVKTRNHMNSSRPRLMFETTISKDNVGEIPQLIKVAEALGVDGIYFYWQIIPGKEYCIDNAFIPIGSKDLPKSKIEIQAAHLKRAPQPCVATVGCYITFDGKVLPCNRLIQLTPREQYSRFQLGDLKHNSLADIWFSSRYKQFRTRIALGMHPSMCRYCPTCLH